MADTKLSDQQVADLVALMRGDGPLDAKVQLVTTVKSCIKQHNVPEASVAQLFDGLRAAAASQHAALVNAGFTALNHLLTRLSRQDPRLLAKEAARTLPVVVDKLGDAKDKLRGLATQAITTLYPVAPLDVERAVRNSALAGKNPRAKEAGMHWLLQAHREQGLQFRAYVPLLMELLEDADGMVRDAAKSTVIDLFKTAPNVAKSDLKRQLKNFKVRPAIEQAIVKSLGSGRPETPADGRPAHGASFSSSTTASSSAAAAAERPVTPAPPAEPPAETVEPMYVNTLRELDDIFRDMAWQFEGKETEQNWMKREQSISALRKVHAGNAPADFPDALVAGLRGMLDGIIKTMTSLRTSLSKEGCGLVQDMAVTLGPAMDPMVELLMQTLVKLSAGTKKISSQLANATVDTILARVSYTPRLMQHIWGACQDKNAQPRLYATGWLKTILRKEAHHKHHMEHTGGLELLEKSIRRGLGDANPGVREKMRSTYWAFWGVWPARADAIMADLDSTAQKLLSKDPSNPNSPRRTVDNAPGRPGLGLSRSTMAPSKPSLRDTMMAQKRAALAAAKNLPARPGSAMAHISPVRTASNTSAAAPGGKAPTRPRAEPTVSVSAGGMSGAPMRPARRRPEMAARPATAGPYSVRDQPTPVEADSPDSFRNKHATPKPRETTPRRAAAAAAAAAASRPPPALASESSAASPAARSAASKIPSPRGSPASLRHSRTAALPASPSWAAAPPTSPSRIALPTSPSRMALPTSPPRMALPSSPARANNEDISLVVPLMASLRASSPQAARPPTRTPASPRSPQAAAAAAASSSSSLGTPSRTLHVYEDPFTDDGQATPRPTLTVAVLEDKPVNEDAAKLQRAQQDQELGTEEAALSPEKARQNGRLLDSGIAKIRARSLDVHGFRKLQSLVRDGRTAVGEERFEALVVGLFLFLEDPLASLGADKAQDVKAQTLATLKLLLRRDRDGFAPHVARGLESLLLTRSAYDARAHVVSGLELLADELVAIGDGPAVAAALTRRLEACADTTVEGCRSLAMGLHVLAEALARRPAFAPAAEALAAPAALAARCLESADSGVRMAAVKLCVALHERVGAAAFWAALGGGVGEDPKSLITYYIVKRQRELQPANGVAGP